jgi:hypothetical protein
MCCADSEGRLEDFFKPFLTHAERMVAEVEGWILGIK